VLLNTLGRSLSSARDYQFDSVALDEANDLYEGSIGLCVSLYSRGEVEKLRLKALVNDAWDS